VQPSELDSLVLHLLEQLQQLKRVQQQLLLQVFSSK
jgi:hypothetical protein